MANAIKRECFKIIASGTKEKIELDFSYERESNSLILTPLKYLKANFSYALIIESLENCLISVNKRILKTPYILKFKTSDSPELKLYVDTEIIDFGEVSKIDYPSYTLNKIEEHNNPIKEAELKNGVLSKRFFSRVRVSVGMTLFMNVERMSLFQ